MSEEPIRFADLQLSGCAGCEVSLLNSEAWINQYRLVFMPLVISVYNVPEVDVLLVTGGVRTDEDLHKLRQAVRCAQKVVAVGTCAISGGVPSLGDREEVRELFLSAHKERYRVPNLLPKCHPIDAFVDVDLYLPGCPPTPELFMAALLESSEFEPSRIVCQECGRKKLRDRKPDRFLGREQGEVEPGICLVNQGFFCVGTSTRGGCGAPCPRAGHPCVGCRGPSDTFIDKESGQWLDSIVRVFKGLTNIPEEEVRDTARSPHMALFLFQFSDYSDPERRANRSKAKVL